MNIAGVAFEVFMGLVCLMYLYIKWDTFRQKREAQTGLQAYSETVLEDIDREQIWFNAFNEVITEEVNDGN